MGLLEHCGLGPEDASMEAQAQRYEVIPQISTDDLNLSVNDVPTLISLFHPKLLDNSFLSDLIFLPRWPGLVINFEPFNGMLIQQKTFHEEQML